MGSGEPSPCEGACADVSGVCRYGSVRSLGTQPPHMFSRDKGRTAPTGPGRAPSGQRAGRRSSRATLHTRSPSAPAQTSGAGSCRGGTLGEASRHLH